MAYALFKTLAQHDTDKKAKDALIKELQPFRLLPDQDPSRNIIQYQQNSGCLILVIDGKQFSIVPVQKNYASSAAAPEDGDAAQVESQPHQKSKSRTEKKLAEVKAARSSAGKAASEGGTRAASIPPVRQSNTHTIDIEEQFTPMQPDKDVSPPKSPNTMRRLAKKCSKMPEKRSENKSPRAAVEGAPAATSNEEHDNHSDGVSLFLNREREFDYQQRSKSPTPLKQHAHAQSAGNASKVQSSANTSQLMFAPYFSFCAQETDPLPQSAADAGAATTHGTEGDAGKPKQTIQQLVESINCNNRINTSNQNATQVQSHKKKQNPQQQQQQPQQPQQQQRVVNRDRSRTPDRTGKNARKRDRATGHDSSPESTANAKNRQSGDKAQRSTEEEDSIAIQIDSHDDESATPVVKAHQDAVGILGRGSDFDVSMLEEFIKSGVATVRRRHKDLNSALSDNAICHIFEKYRRVPQIKKLRDKVREQNAGDEKHYVFLEEMLTKRRDGKNQKSM